MNGFVIDTNVPIVANGKETRPSNMCVLSCIELLERARRGIISLDQTGLILAEYRDNLHAAGQPGVGDAFFKWLFENQAYSERCEMVRVTKEGESFSELPRPLSAFDKSDHKFVVVALGSQNSPTIYNASDSDWSEFAVPLREAGLNITELCPTEIKNFRHELVRLSYREPTRNKNV